MGQLPIFALIEKLESIESVQDNKKGIVGRVKTMCTEQHTENARLPIV